ncbi:MAG: peroxiredoxin [Candidatus Heimdallarchaeota archaeon]|nr:peroxiredoxin [Candidatus Heimdallarchaeota archaeon]
MTLLIGQKAPEFKAVTTHGVIDFPNDARFEGKWIILFSHPADFTPVCTTEFMAFQARKKQFDKLNTELIGLSVDQVFSHIKWVDWIKDNMNVEIEFPFIADNGTIAKLFNMYAEGVDNTIRAVFFIDPKKTIRLILYYPAELGRNFDEILRIIKAFQVADKNSVAMPADWPNNKEGFEDKVIVPPAKSVADAKKRLADAAKDDSLHAYDWWLVTKKL